MLDKLLFEHPRDIGETYSGHAGHAFYIGSRLIVSGFACLIHGLLPGTFVRTASNTLESINQLMASRKAAAPEQTQSGRALSLSATMVENPSN